MRTVVIASANGRLGNQLFQILGLVCNCSSKKHIIYLLGYDNACADILKLPTHVRLVKCNRLLHKSYSWLSRSIFFSIIIRFFFVLAQEDNKEAFISMTYPLIQLPFSPVLFRDAYFQNPLFISNPKKLAQLSVNPQFVADSSKNTLSYLNQLSCIYCFVHIRRGDYCFWPNKDQRAILPMSFYIECISVICENHGCDTFLLSSDDLDYAHDLLYVLKNNSRFSSCSFYILDSDSPSMVIGMMLIAPIKVISSSFSWIASLLGVIYAPKSHIAVYAPLYWSGHRKKSWYPPGSFWDKAIYIPVTQ